MPRAQMSAWNSLGTFSELTQRRFSVSSSLTENSPVRSKSACCLALGSGTRKNASHWGLALT